MPGHHFRSYSALAAADIMPRLQDALETEAPAFYINNVQPSFCKIFITPRFAA